MYTVCVAQNVAKWKREDSNTKMISSILLGKNVFLFQEIINNNLYKYLLSRQKVYECVIMIIAYSLYIFYVLNTQPHTHKL